MPVASILAALAAAAAQNPSPDPIEGRWRSPGGNSIVAIAPCGSELCGTVAWASDKAKKDASKTTSQLVGAQLLTGLRRRPDGRWEGKLFVPDKNLRVTAKLQLVSPGQLKLSGCAIGKSACKSQLWTRVTEAAPISE